LALSKIVIIVMVLIAGCAASGALYIGSLESKKMNIAYLIAFGVNVGFDIVVGMLRLF
jgi:hypothetical protein